MTSLKSKSTLLFPQPASFSLPAKKGLLLLCFLLTFFQTTAQVYKDTHAGVEDRVSSLLSQMTLEEKISYIGGEDVFYIRAISRLGLPRIKMTDGPVGVRTWGASTAYPATVLAAASWDTTIAKQMGSSLGRDAKARGVHILLAPGVNIFRASMGGRNFEYLGEDPYLTSRLAVNYIKGVQSQGVVATVKHYAANNQEWDRHHVSSDVDERTLQEIYLPAFKAAVTEAKVGAVMNSYNLVNGVHATQSAHLNLEILKRDWGFKGILMSDWESTYDGVAAAKNGLDLEMPSAKFMNKAALMPALANGTISEDEINDKVRRILRVIFGYGFYDKDQLDKSIPENNPQSDSVALNIARGGAVLLKNEKHTLPFSTDKIKTLAVLGPNADMFISGGGSSLTTPFHYTSLLKGLQNLLGDKVKIVFMPVFGGVSEYVHQSVFYTKPGSTNKGLRAEYFNNMELKGKPVNSRIEETIDHLWKKQPDVEGMHADSFSIRWTGIIRPVKAGKYHFVVRGDDGFRLWVDEKLVIDEWHDHGSTIRNTDIDLAEGKEYNIKLEYYDKAKDADIAFAWYPSATGISEAVKIAQKADAAIVCIGFNHILEHEGADRPFDLPAAQDSLINAIASVNNKTVVVLNAGGNVNMQNWLGNIKGLLHAWYPGQEGGTALAEILFGKTNPSGKLPVSFEKEWKDNPVFNNYYDADKDKHVLYKEGLFVGYRYWDTAHVQPQFPFGFGLSYTSFSYSNLKIENIGTNGNPALKVSFDIANTGNYDGAEVAQLYIHQQQSKELRPVKELKGFSKIFLKKGTRQTVTIELGSGAFSYFKNGRAFGYDPGLFNVMVGASSKDIKLDKSITIL